MVLAFVEFVESLSDDELRQWNERFRIAFLISTPIWAIIITWLVINMATESINEMHQPTYWVPYVSVDGRA